MKLLGVYHSEMDTISLTKYCNQDNVVKLLEHEYLHAILLQIGEEEEACEKFDNIQEFLDHDWY